MRGQIVEPASRRVAWWLFAAAIGAFFLLSAPALLRLGIPYDAPYGPPIAKIHPGSFLLVLAWALALTSHGNPLGVLLRQPAQEPLISVYFACMVVVFAWVVLQQGTSGAAYIIQTLWMPAIAVYTLRLLAPRRARQAVVLIMGMLCANAALALAEYFLKARLVPIAIEQVGNDYFRATAFLGHPLLNANVTTALLPAVTLLPIRTRWRAAIALLLLTSVLAFGARSALVAAVAVYGSCGTAYLLANLLRGRYDYREMTGGFLALAFAVSGLALLAMATGLGDRIFQNLAWDNSASVRARAWLAFDYLRGSDWWLGLPPTAIERIELRMGLDPTYETIENFWIYAFLQFGAIGYLPFIVGLSALTAWMFKTATPAMRFGVVLFYLVASTANALTSKTVSVSLLVVAIASCTSVRARSATWRLAFPRQRIRLRPATFRAPR